MCVFAALDNAASYSESCKLQLPEIFVKLCQECYLGHWESCKDVLFVGTGISPAQEQAQSGIHGRLCEITGNYSKYLNRAVWRKQLAVFVAVCEAHFSWADFLQ